MQIVVILGLLFLQISFCVHVYFLIQYAIRRTKRYLRLFVLSFISNMIVSIGLITLFLYRPEWVHGVDMRVVTWLMSGVFMIMMLMVKFSLFRRIWRRAHDPSNYHFNFFGKKVLHSRVVHKVDIGIFFMTMPVFLIAGSYFVARLINVIMYGNL